MKRSKQLILDLESVMNDIIYIIQYSQTKMTLIEKPKWIKKITSMKYGKQALKRTYKQSNDQLSHSINIKILFK